MRGKLKSLLGGYFRQGGMQLQINVADQAVLRDALKNPERHSNLIVRTGGHSEYWQRRSETLRRTILERVEHE